MQHFSIRKLRDWSFTEENESKINILLFFLLFSCFLQVCEILTTSSATAGRNGDVGRSVVELGAAFHLEPCDVQLQVFPGIRIPGVYEPLDTVAHDGQHTGSHRPTEQGTCQLSALNLAVCHALLSCYSCGGKDVYHILMAGCNLENMWAGTGSSKGEGRMVNSVSFSFIC